MSKAKRVTRRGCREPAFDKSGGLFPIIDEGHGERLAGGTRRKRRDRQRLTGNLEARFEHRSNLQVANKFSVEKSIEQYHREGNERPTGCKIVSVTS
jgi:hypothetical protein